MSLSIGQSAGYINALENRNGFPSMQVFFYICEYLGVTPAEFFEDGTYRDDVMLVMVSPPNEKGYVSIGVSVDYTRPAADNAKLLIAQVNRRMPFTYGNTLIHVSEIDRFVEADQELYELQPPRIGDAEIAIGEYCASLIRTEPRSLWGSDRFRMRSADFWAAKRIWEFFPICFPMPDRPVREWRD